MRNKILLPYLIVGGIMLLFAIIYAVCVDVYDALFWTRFVFTLIGILITAVGVMRALSYPDTPHRLRAFTLLVMYIFSMFSTLCFLPSARWAGIFAAIQCIGLVLVMVLNAGIHKQNP